MINSVPSVKVRVNGGMWRVWYRALRVFPKARKSLDRVGVFTFYCCPLSANVSEHASAKQG